MSSQSAFDPQDLYTKFLPDFANPDNRSGGRGGFCFETCVFFLHILRALGFKAYPTSARIRIRDHFTRVPSGPFVGPRHVVNLVILQDGSIWSCDVGFGGDGPTSPLALSVTPEQEPEVVPNLGSQDVRLRRGVFPETVREDANLVWFYEYRNGKDSAWNTYYAFGESEASDWDLQCANFWVVSHPDSFQRKQILSVKFIKGDDVEGNGVACIKGGELNGGTLPGEVTVVGKIMLADDVVKRNMGGKTETVRHCRTEMERIEALKEYFGIYLTDEEQHGIKGFETELK
ncbi:hypothetical protein N0V82_010630 [Gnomoniopsis sp. IMI 355080]|nr:hypothetical protein N0V82_010630 [Gnomoniopsis sp. IMI 355080]